MPKRENGELRFKELIETLPNVAVQGYNAQREVIYWNEASERLYGYTKEEAYGQRLEELIIPEPMRETVINGINQWITQGIEIPASELMLMRKDGSSVAVLSSHAMLHLDTDHPQLFCIDVDVTQQQRTTKQLKELATRDTLTGLINRRQMEEEVQRKMDEAKVYSHEFGLLFIDLDHFKDVNDTLGHHAGDELLKFTAQRMLSKLRPYDRLARFGGDEFVLLLPTLQNQSTLSSVADRLISAFQEPFTIVGHEVYVTVSIGMGLFPSDGDNVKDLFKNVDTAMYEAKRSGRNCYRYFSNAMNVALEQHQLLVRGLHHALEKDEFYLVYQPQVHLKTGVISSCEALLRWSPEDQRINPSPAHFIPIAERSDLILRIGSWVLHQVCRQIVSWRQDGLNIDRVDVNISGKQLAQPHFLEQFLSILAQYGLNAADVGIELTEHVLIFAKDSIVAELKQAKQNGTHISIDDFGTGYSSLSYLKQFPIQTLKIDRAFIKDIPQDVKDAAIVRAIVQVGQTLGLNIVVEGVETEVQKVYCQGLNCDLAQGYFFFKPLSPVEFGALLKRQMDSETPLIEV
jgi:diguanylate cyclase (GGDEF)-like protein/PAS domain S-box-containing protein